MTSGELLQMQVMNNFFARLSNLSDTDLMKQRQVEMELQGNLKKIIDEMNRRTKEE